MKLPSKLYSRAQVRELDRIAIEVRGIAGISLMRRAASACVDTLMAHWPKAKHVSVFCGSGNNAGDGYIVAALLAEKNFDVSVFVVGRVDALSADALLAREYCQASNARMEDFCPNTHLDFDAEVIVDALLGTGIKGELRENYQAAIHQINADEAPVLAVDIASGLNGDTGQISGVAINASVTVTFIGLKRGLFTLYGPDQSGEIVFADLGVPADIYAQVGPAVECLDYEMLIKYLPDRARHTHKKNFGHVLVVGGDKGMGGAVAMSAEAALRSGAGLVSVVTHKSHANSLLARRPELMVCGVGDEPSVINHLLEQADLIVLGPGLGQSDWSKRMFNKIRFDIESHSDDEGIRYLIDADGLNLLAHSPMKSGQWVLTPHPGEACNLLDDKIPLNDRFAAADALQKKYGGIVLLKGAGTIIHSEDQTSLCGYGNPGMATAGMGDVLSGVIAALLGQGCMPEYATQLGAVVHSLAADVCVGTEGERGLIATDLLPQIRRLLNAG